MRSVTLLMFVDLDGQSSYRDFKITVQDQNKCLCTNVIHKFIKKINSVFSILINGNKMWKTQIKTV